MSTEPSSQPSQQRPPTSKYHGTPPWMHNFALAAAIIAPIGMLLPPRRLDLRFTVLSAGAFWGTSQLAHDYTGRSIYRRYLDRMDKYLGGDLPEKAKQTQALMQAERLRRQQELGAAEGRQPECKETGREKGVKGVLRRMWMGEEDEDWIKQRKEKEKEALEEGRGYMGLITDQIREVWNQEGKKGGSKAVDEEDSTDKKTPLPKRPE